LEDRFMTRGRIITVLLFLAVSGVALTALMAAKDANDKPADPPKTTVSGKKLVCLGNVDTEDLSVDIFPDNYPLPSKVVRVLVKAGDEVKKGQPLLELDVELLRLKVEEAEKAIVVAKTEKEKAEAVVKGFPPQLAAAEKEWEAKQQELLGKKRELDEVRRLFGLQGGGTKTKAELDQAEAAYKAAELNLEAARIKWEGLKDVGAPKYLVQTADAMIEKLKNMKQQAEVALRQYSCTAPEDGRILRSNVTEGLTFGPQTRSPAFWFLKKGPLIVRAEISQEFANRVKHGAAAKIEDEADRSQTWKGKVIKVGDDFLPKRNTGATVELLAVSDERVLECLISIDVATGETPPKYGQKVRVTLGE
jgi:multidrug resistance efflux pump